MNNKNPPPPPIYLPYMANPEVVSMGLHKLDPSRWIEPDQLFDDYIANKQRLFDHNSTDVYASLPGAEAAEQEMAQRLCQHLQGNPDYPAERREEFATADIRDLWDIGMRVQDDLCLLQQSDGEYCLSAASLCAPSEWNLQEKIGRPIHEIHAPVPGLNQKIGAQINHVLDKLSPLRPMQRFNWSLKDDPRLALFPNRKPFDDTGSLYLRVERQTLTRLPASNGIAFTIRIYIYPLEQLVSVDGALDSLQQALNAMSPDEVRYKAVAPLYPRFHKFCKALTSRA